MANYRFSDGTEERELFNAYWKLCQNFWKPEDNDDYWKTLHDACVDFGKKHGSFAQDLALSLVKEMERKWKVNGKI